MICPNCGEEIADDLLYCSKCGEEVKLIPEYEPEIENEINGTLQDLELISLSDDEEDVTGQESKAENAASATNELPSLETLREAMLTEEDLDEGFLDEENADDPYYDDTDDFDEEYDGDFLDELEDFEDDEDVVRQIALAIRESRFRWLYIILGLIVIGGIGLVIFYLSQHVYEDNSSVYQASLAREAAAQGNFVEAIDHMEKALLLDDSDSSLKFTLADYYFEIDEEEKALLMLWEIIYDKDINSVQAYRQLIEYYANNKEYGKIENILSNCEDQTVLAQFSDYLAEAPEFSEEPGTYDRVLWVKLSSVSNGTIYYTLDGSDPTTESEVYTSPIHMELGIYEVNAMFVNNYGIQSEISSGVFTVDVRKPDPPLVTPESGEYNEPEMIEAEGIKYGVVYYTTDGTIPTDESTEYVGPIPMPIGHSHFIFLSYSQEGVAGEIADIEYDLNIESELDLQEVINHLKQYNVNNGKTIDLAGHLPGNTSRYSYTIGAALKLDDVVYYLITENVIDSAESSIKTGAFYLADVKTGDLFKAIRDDEEMTFTKGAEIKPEDYAVPEPVAEMDVPPAPPMQPPVQQ
ncbi:MAG: chitobiase/beta-hexosaminidase C-terminal domain-containing protein [Lachnospiraceae bacterium]|nr:chitobiase/beta-hexosaminidase C-terminal domain-containing protein [Lachnospiraceae bacterium]